MYLEYCVQFWLPLFKKNLDRLRQSKEGPLGKAKGVSSFLPGEEKDQGAPHHGVPVLKGWLYRALRLSLQKEQLEKTREKRSKLHWAFQCKKEMFYSEYNNLQKQSPQGCGRVLIDGCFQDAIGQGAT